MKKKILVLSVMVIVVAFAGIANAASLMDSTHSTVFGGGVYKPSTNVSVCVSSNDNAYSAASMHSGSLNQTSGKIFATMSTSPAMPSLDNPSAVVAASTCQGPTTVPSGFNSTQF